MTMFTAEEETTLLACTTNKKEVSSLAWLHGFIFGLAIISEEFKSNEWNPDGGFPQAMMGMFRKENTEILARCLIGTYNRIAQQNRDDELHFPFDCDPVKSEDIPLVRLWIQGFYAAILYCPDIWLISNGEAPDNANIECFTEIDEDGDGDEIISYLTVIMAVAFPERITEFFPCDDGDDVDALSCNDPELEVKLFRFLPDAVDVVREYAEKAGVRKRAQRSETKTASRENR